MKQLNKKILLLTITATVSLVMMELAIRTLLPHYDPRRQIVFHILDHYDGAAIGPLNETIRQRTPKGDYDLNVFFNQYGFRDELDLTHSAPNDFFAVGDSFTMGWGVEPEERFSNLVAAQTGIRFFNIGIPGDFQQYRGLIQYARDHGAVVSNILVGICMNNDLKNYSTIDKVQPAVYGDRQRWKAWLRATLQSRSAIYLACSYELQKVPALRQAFERIGISRDINELTLQNVYDQEVMISSADACITLAETVGRKHARFVVIPSLALWIGDNMETEAKIHQEFVAMLIERDLQVLDLRPAFDKTGNARSYYFDTDAHWNPAGHAFAAALISEWIRP